MGTYRIAVLSGDGIGPEVIKESLKPLKRPFLNYGSIVKSILSVPFVISQATRTAQSIEAAVANVLKDSQYHTIDLGGKASTSMVGDAVTRELKILV